MFVGFIEDALRRIKAKAIEMEFVDPVATVGDEKFAYWSRICSIEINRVAPVIFVLARQIIVGVNAKIIAVGAEVVVNHIENHAQAERMRVINEGAQIVRRAVQVCRRKKIDAVVTPPEISGE